MNTKSQTLADKAYEQLREDILDGVLAPDTKLNICELCETYSIGNSPMREALTRLAQSGLVIAERLKGFRVSPISMVELRDIYSVRRLLDCEALRLAVENGNDEWEAQVVANFHRLEKFERCGSDTPPTFQEWQDRHHHVIYTIILACDSPSLINLHDCLFEKTERYRRLWYRHAIKSGIDPYKYRKSLKPMVDAVIERDTDKLVKAYQKKMRSWLEETETTLIENDVIASEASK